MDRWNLSLEEAAETLGISIHTIRAWVREGRIGHVKIGRRVLIPVSDLEKFQAENRIPPRTKAKCR